MKICFISFFAYPLFGSNQELIFGGAEVQLYNLASQLKRDHDVTFIVGNFGQKEIEIFEDIRVIKSVKLGSKYGIIEKVKSIWVQLIAMRNSDADIFIKRAAGPEVGIIAIYCMLFHKKFIYMTAHEIDCSGEYKKKNWFLGLLYEFGLKRANIVITQNNDHRELLNKNYGIDSIVLSSGYDIPQLRVESENYILWVARLDEWKQPEILFELALSLPNENFTMIAPSSGDKGYAKEIEEKARKIKNIKFIRGVHFTKIDPYFQFAKLFVNTSRYEGFPNTFVQATMHGVPIVSLNVDPDNFIEKNNIGFYAKNDFPSMREYVMKILKDKKMYDMVSINSYDYAKNNHDIREIYSKFLEIIKKYEK